MGGKWQSEERLTFETSENTTPKSEYAIYSDYQLLSSVLWSYKLYIGLHRAVNCMQSWHLNHPKI